MKTVTSTDGTSIAYERDGAGPPLFLLHGGGMRRYWDPIVPRFESRRFGSSSRTSGSRRTSGRRERR